MVDGKARKCPPSEVTTEDHVLNIIITEWTDDRMHIIINGMEVPCNPKEAYGGGETTKRHSSSTHTKSHHSSSTHTKTNGSLESPKMKTVEKTSVVLVTESSKSPKPTKTITTATVMTLTAGGHTFTTSFTTVIHHYRRRDVDVFPEPTPNPLPAPAALPMPALATITTTARGKLKTRRFEYMEGAKLPRNLDDQVNHPPTTTAGPTVTQTFTWVEQYGKDAGKTFTSTVTR